MSIYVCNECNDAAFKLLNKKIEGRMYLEKHEVVALDDYFTKRAGYISHEFDDVVHIVINKINNFLKAYP